MVTLLPRIPELAAERILDQFLRSGPMGWAGFHPDRLPDGVRFAATGGSQVTATDLGDFRRELVEVSQKCGFGSEGTRIAFARFDSDVAALLSETSILRSGEALRDDTWTFIGVVLAPDITHWRFGAARERYLGGVRNTFQRLWLRARVLDRGDGSVERWGLLQELTEDALVQIVERPSIGGDPILAREVAEAWIRAAKLHGRAAMEPIMRRAALRVRIWNELRSLSTRPTETLRSVLDEAFEASPPRVSEPVGEIDSRRWRAHLGSGAAERTDLYTPGIGTELSGGGVLSADIGSSHIAAAETEASRRGWLSPKSQAALDKLKNGGGSLTGGERNSLVHLLTRLKSVGAAQREADQLTAALNSSDRDGERPDDAPSSTRRSKWAIWRAK
ncbi:hypothetical protein ABIA14_002747 [Sinorhizobium fredii]